MKKTVNVYEFCNLMNSDEFSNFSHDALLAIFDHIEQKEEEIGEEMEFSRADIRAMYSEYQSRQQAIEDYNLLDVADISERLIDLPGGGVVIINE